MPATTAVAAAAPRHPDRALIETLNAQRRERYHCARKEQRHSEYVVFPPPQAPQKEHTNGVLKPGICSAPGALEEGNAQESSKDPSRQAIGDDTAVGALLEGAPDAGTLRLNNDKSQKQRSAHVLLRLLALGFIVPLTRTDDNGLPIRVHHSSYSIQDAINFMRSFLREQPAILSHFFHSRPAESSSLASSLESTPFDLWLLPRILVASAVLNGRLAGILTTSPEADEIQQALCDLALDILDLSIGQGRIRIARCILMESLRVSVHALSAIDRPCFLNTAPPPIWLTPNQSVEADDEIAFFESTSNLKELMDSTASTPSGEGIARMWLLEDHTRFPLHWWQARRNPESSALAMFLFLLSSTLCLRLSRRRIGSLSDIAATACDLIESNWQCALRLDPRLFAIGQDYSNVVATLRVQAALNADLAVFRERFTIHISQVIGQTVVANGKTASRQLIAALHSAIRLWSKIASPTTSHGEALMTLSAYGRTMIQLCARQNVSIETSGVPDERDERQRRDQEMQTVDLAFGVLLFLLENDASSILLDAESRLELMEALSLGDAMGESGDLDHPLDWIASEKRSRFAALLRESSNQRTERRAEDEDAMKVESTSDRELSRRSLEEHIQTALDNPNAKLRQTSFFQYFFCADAGTLYLKSFSRGPSKLHCSICENVEENATSISEAGHAHGKPSKTARWRLDALIDMISASQRQEPASRPALAPIISRSLNHRCDRLDSLDGQNVSLFAQIGLTMPRRIDRIIFGEAIATLMKWLFEASTFQGHESMLAREVEKLFRVIDVILESRIKLKETALLCIAALARLKIYAIRQRALLSLVLQLSSDTFSKSQSYSIITHLANTDRCTTFQLLAPFLDVIGVEVVERMSRSPMLFLEVLQLTRQNQSKFLQTTLQSTLPRLIQLNDHKTLDLVAKGVGSDIQTLCFNNAPAVLKSLLLQLPASRRDRSIHIFIENVRGEATQDINVKSLIKAYHVELLGHLVSHLGSDTHRKAATEGLHYMNTALNERQRTNKSVSSRDLALSAFLKDEVLAILSWYNEELMDAHGKRQIVHKSMVTRSIGMLIHLIGEKIANVTPQLLATFNTTMQVDELMLPTLESWLALIDTLRYQDLGPCVGPTVAALLAYWRKFGLSEKRTANAILTHVIVDSPPELRPFIEQDLPQLDSIRMDVPEVWSKLSEGRALSRKTPEQRLKNLVARAASENQSMCLQALVELKDFIEIDRQYVEQVTSGNAFDPVVTHLIRTLLQAASRDDDDIRNLSLQILGMTGAIDPDRMASIGNESDKFMLHDFNDKEALTEFSVHLIRTVLVGAFKGTNDPKHQAALAFAIQELLKIAGFTSALLPTRDGQSARGSVVNLRTRQRWNSLSEYMDTLAPLLDSKYSVQHGDMSFRAKPFYRHATSFREWVQMWTNDLILGAPGDLANDIFGVFRSAIRDHDLSIAQHLLPHLVIDVVTLGSEEQYWEIHGEIVAVLEDQVNASTVFEEERRLLSAQLVFAILDHLSLWQRSRRRGNQRTSRHKRDPVDVALGQVDKLMQAISYDLMAKASLKCRAYARSLLNFEQQIRKIQKGEATDGQLQGYYEELHLIYAKLDQPDGMEGVSTLVLQPSLDHQIREHESTGRWTSAQSCWEVKIQEKPDDLELHHGLLRCLRNLGHYDTMRTHIRGVLSIHPDWTSALNPFYIEGSCILSDWSEVRRSLSTASIENDQAPQHALARVMLAMHEGDAKGFTNSIKDARSLMGKPLITAQTTGYASIYQSVAKLHELYELEMIGRALGLVDNQTDQLDVAELTQRLAFRLDSTLPSYRTREPILSLRRSAFSTQIVAAFKDGIAQSWVTSSKIARRAGHNQTAYSAALQAAQWKAPLAIVQHAKLLAKGDQRQAALHELASSLRAIEPPAKNDASLIHSYANAHLFLARLSELSGRGRANEIIELYKKCTELDPHSEKMWYHLGHYYDQYTERDLKSQTNLLLQHFNVCKNYLRAAVCGTKFFYRTVPRVLTIWLMYGDNERFLTALRKTKSSSSAKLDTETENILKVYVKFNETVHKYIERIAPYQWLAVLPQLLSRVTHKNELVWKTLRELICNILRNYPDQAMWTMLAGSQSNDKGRRSRVLEIIAFIKSNPSRGQDKSQFADSIDRMLQIGREMLYLCDFPLAKDAKQLNMKTDFPKLLALAQRGSIILPLQSSLQVSMPSNGKAMSSHQVFDENLPTIKDMDQTIEILSSLQKPRKIVIIGSDGKSYAFLCKPKDDLRKDARLMEFDSMINNLLQSNSESRKRRLYIRTYSVVTLNEECGLIEWVPNTIGLRHILNALYQSRGISLYNHQIKADLDLARADPKHAGEIFETKVGIKFPPVFHEWFIAMFPEPSAWLDARLNYGHTLAVMSMVGHVLGLGDRHGENILFDSMTGDTVHVDLNCLFDKGTTFEIPERVPFRLTQNLVDALGVTGCEGVFRRAAEISMGILRENKDSLMSVLEAMVHDPLVEWGIDDRSSKARAGTAVREDPRMIEARKSLDPVRSKLDGNLKRQAFNDPLAPTANLSTNSLVDALIREATSSTNLALMYVGWGSYL